jgi:hypothetical protein
MTAEGPGRRRTNTKPTHDAWGGPKRREQGLYLASFPARFLDDLPIVVAAPVVGMAAETNALATALQIPVDPEFSIGQESRLSQRAARPHVLFPLADTSGV